MSIAEQEIAEEVIDDNAFIDLDHNISIDEKSKRMPILKVLKVIFTQKIFILNALAQASLFFIITVVQFWGTDYMKTVLLVPNPNSIKLSFAIICITSPTLGVIVGGLITTKIGGYEKKQASLLVVILAGLASGFAILVTFADKIITFTIFLWLVLFFGGAILAPITGIIMTSLSIELRGSANSITSLFSNLFGYLPGPFIYGTIHDSTKKWKPKFAWAFVMFYSLTGLIFLIIGAILRYKKINQEKVKSSETRKISKEIQAPNTLQKMFGNHMDTSMVKSDESDLDKTNKLETIEENIEEGERNSSVTEDIKIGSKNTPYFHGPNVQEYANVQIDEIVSPAFGAKTNKKQTEINNIEQLNNISEILQEGEEDYINVKPEIEMTKED